MPIYSTSQYFLARSNHIEEQFKAKDIELLSDKDLVWHFSDAFYSSNLNTIRLQNSLNSLITNLCFKYETLNNVKWINPCPNYSSVRSKVAKYVNNHEEDYIEYPDEDGGYIGIPYYNVRIADNSHLLFKVSEIFDHNVSLEKSHLHSGFNEFLSIYNSDKFIKLFKRPKILVIDEPTLQISNENVGSLLEGEDYIYLLMEFIEDPFTLLRFSKICKICYEVYVEMKPLLWERFKKQIILLRNEYHFRRSV